MEDKVNFILQRIEKDEAFKRMFFKKLSTTENPYPWFEKLQKAGYLDPKTNKNPILQGDSYSIPYWFALDYLENLATHLSKKPDQQLLEGLLNVIDSIIDYTENGQRIENPHTDYKVLKIIFSLPIANITQKHIHFIDTALANRFSAVSLLSSEIDKTIIPYLVENKAKDLLEETLRIILRYKPSKQTSLSFLQFTSILDDYWFSEIIKKYSAEIIEICGMSLAQILIDLIDEILKKDKNSFNIAAIPAIEDNSQNFLEDNYEFQLIYLLRETLQNTKPPAQEDLLTKCLKSDVQILKRIGIHIINYYYEEYNHLFWLWDGNPLEEIGLKHEIYEFILKHKSVFSAEQINKLINWVKSIKITATKDAPKDSPLYAQTEAYVKLEWLSALSDIDNKEIEQLIEHYSKIYPYKIEHPGYIYWSTPVQVSGIGSPEVFPSEVRSQSNSQLVQYIKAYKPKEGNIFLNKEDVLYSFSRVVRDNPKKFVTDMAPFLELDFGFQEALVSGVVNAWRDKKQFPLEELFDFIIKTITQPTFKENTSLQKNFLVKSIADLIFEGTRDEQNVFDERFLPNCEAILLRLVENAYSTVTDDTTDMFTAVLNSPLGIVYYAMITYSLRFAKVYRKDTVEKWAIPIKTYYQSALDLNRTIEFEVSLGTFLPQLYYLDKPWVIENINKLFPKENGKIWGYGFSSYLFHSTTLSKEIYCLLRDNKHYKMALENATLAQKHALTKLPQHICLAYLNDLEDLSKGSLVSDLITGKNITYLVDLVTFVWHLRGKLEPKMKEKIKPLWAAIINYISSLPDQEKYRDVLAHLSYWLALVDYIDVDIVNWMKLSNKYINDRSAIFYLEYLNKHVSKTPQFVAEIFYDLLSNVHYFPYFKKEEIVAIVKTLFEKGQREKAKRICTLYVEAGFDFLRKLFEDNANK